MIQSICSRVSNSE